MKRFGSKVFFVALAMVAGLVMPSSAWASVTMVIKIGSIQGESTVVGHEHEIDVLAWSWGISGSTTPKRSGDVRSCSIQDFSFTKYIDTATGPLLVAAVTGAIVDPVVLRVVSGGPGTNLTLTFTNATVSSVSTGGSGGEDRLTENVTLHFTSLSGTYTPAGGSPVNFTVNPCA
jgi:type VI secretion system secreted protein Hcp